MSAYVNIDNSTYKIVIFSMFLSLGILLSVFETVYLPPLAIPGAKIGLSSLITLIMLPFLPWRDIIANVFLRSLLTSILTGTFLSPALFFSISAGIGSSIVMIIFFYLFYKKVFSYIGISITGATTHNVIQLIIATYILGTNAVWVHLPLLLIVGTMTGMLNGIFANLVMSREDLKQFYRLT